MNRINYFKLQADYDNQKRLELLNSNFFKILEKSNKEAHNILLYNLNDKTKSEIEDIIKYCLNKKSIQKINLF